MSVVKFTPEVIRFCRERAPAYYAGELLALAKDEFKIDFSENVDTFADKLRRFEIYCRKKKRKVPPGYRRKSKYTPEQLEWLKNNVKGCGFPLLTARFNETFKTGFTVLQIRSYCGLHGLRNGVSCNTPRYQTGDSRFDERGCEMIKVSMTGNAREQWKPKHRLVWEAANGPVPKGHVVIFADRNKSNFALDNLLLVPRGIFTSLNRSGCFYDNADFTKAAVTVFEHSKVIKNAIKRLEEEKEHGKLQTAKQG